MRKKRKSLFFLCLSCAHDCAYILSLHTRRVLTQAQSQAQEKENFPFSCACACDYVASVQQALPFYFVFAHVLANFID